MATLGLVIAALTRGWRTTARWTLASNVALKGHPVMPQRYNRALLAGQFGGS